MLYAHCTQQWPPHKPPPPFWPFPPASDGQAHPDWQPQDPSHTPAKPLTEMPVLPKSSDGILINRVTPWPPGQPERAPSRHPNMPGTIPGPGGTRIPIPVQLKSRLM